MIEQNDISKDMAEIFTILLSPFAPHMAEEMWEIFGHKSSIAHQPWPKTDQKYLTETTIEFAVQVNGKLRGTVQASTTASQDEVRKLALQNEKVSSYVKGEIVKEIFVPKKLYNFVVKG